MEIQGEASVSLTLCKFTITAVSRTAGLRIKTAVGSTVVTAAWLPFDAVSFNYNKTPQGEGKTRQTPGSQQKGRRGGLAMWPEFDPKLGQASIYPEEPYKPSTGGTAISGATYIILKIY